MEVWVSPCLMTTPPELVTNVPTCGGTIRTTTYRKEYQVDSSYVSRHRPSRRRQLYLSPHLHHNYAGHPWQPAQDHSPGTDCRCPRPATLETTPIHKSNQCRGLWRSTSATLTTNFGATTEEHSDHSFPRPLSLRPEAYNHSNKRLLSIHDTEEDRLEHENTLDASDFSEAYPQKPPKKT